MPLRVLKVRITMDLFDSFGIMRMTTEIEITEWFTMTLGHLRGVAQASSELEEDEADEERIYDVRPQ